jgi:hypothetical protein
VPVRPAPGFLRWTPSVGQRIEEIKLVDPEKRHLRRALFPMVRTVGLGFIVFPDLLYKTGGFWENNRCRCAIKQLLVNALRIF